ncbi:heavy-metal-associated domain-containing protein [Allomeiothermus silvanus]|uniref:heavy-metal-associated domain-containing protein n=1 Tax=Allomeiothermus silvanus TaxID=52022 RepID=UPI0023F452C7|nr:heavy-metal-associated domain-containing protein [Allomeiothermus silvanus]
MNRVLIGVRGVEQKEQMEKIVLALSKLEGVGKAVATSLGQVEVEYDAHRLTVMDLIRTVREQGFLAGML